MRELLAQISNEDGRIWAPGLNDATEAHSVSTSPFRFAWNPFLVTPALPVMVARYLSAFRGA